MASGGDDSGGLIERAARGDGAARQEILARDRGRLRRMAAEKIDRGLAGRVDPSDVVQEAMADATRQLPRFLEERPLPVSAWLWRLTWERIVEARRRHILARRRSVRREVAPDGRPDRPCGGLAGLADTATSPSRVAVRNETAACVRSALAGLPDGDRDLLVRRFVDRCSVAEIAAALGVTPGAVMTRQTRALAKLKRRLDGKLGGES